MDIDVTAEGRGGLSIKFTTDKKKTGYGAQCIAECVDPDATATTTSTSTTVTVPPTAIGFNIKY